MGVELGGQPCSEPAEALQWCQAQGLPTPWLGRANSFRCPIGQTAGAGVVLLTRASLDKLGLDTPHDLVFTDGDTDGSRTITLKSLLIIKARAFSPGLRDDPACGYWCEIADRRHRLKMTAIDKAYNVRSSPGTEDYFSATLDGGSPWSWSSLVDDIWTTIGTGADDLGPYSGLPYTPDGTPVGLSFYGWRAYDALGHVLGRIGCALKLDPITDTFSIVRLSIDDATAEDALDRLDGARTFDGEPLDSTASTIPETCRVLFPASRSTVDATGGSPWFASDQTDPEGTSEGVVSGTFALVYDDLPARYDSGGSLQNAAELDDRAAERAADYFRRARQERRLLCFTGARSEAGIRPGAQIALTSWYDLGDGCRTEVVSFPDPPGPGLVRGDGGPPAIPPDEPWEEQVKILLQYFSSVYNVSTGGGGGGFVLEHVSLAASQNNYVLPNDCNILVVDPSNNISFTGFVPPAHAHTLWIVNKAASMTITLAHQDPASTAANRMQLPSSVVLTWNQAFGIAYSDVDDCWYALDDRLTATQLQAAIGVASRTDPGIVSYDPTATAATAQEMGRGPKRFLDGLHVGGRDDGTDASPDASAVIRFMQEGTSQHYAERSPDSGTATSAIQTLQSEATGGAGPWTDTIRFEVRSFPGGDPDGSGFYFRGTYQEGYPPRIAIETAASTFTHGDTGTDSNGNEFIRGLCVNVGSGTGGYTDEQAQDAVGGILTDTASIDLTYDDAGATISADVKPNGISDAMLRDSAARSVIGREGNTAGDPADIIAGTDGFVLRRSGVTIAFGTVDTAGITDDAVTFAKVQNIATGKVLGRGTASSGNVEELTLGQGLTTDTGPGLALLTQMSIALDGSGLKLSGDETSPGNSELYGTSTTGTKGWFPKAQMSIIDHASGLKLDGDSASPGNSKYYGTDSGGTKGFYDVSAGGGGSTYLYKSADQATNSTTPVDVTGMTFSVAANKAYAVRAFIIWQTANTGNSIRLGVNGPTSPSLVQIKNAKDQSTTGGLDQVFNAQTTGYDTSNPAQTTEGNANTNLVWMMDGVFVCGGTGGTFALRLWAEVNTSNVTIKAGSYLEYKLLN